MELELGLALPNPPPMMTGKGCNKYSGNRNPRNYDGGDDEGEEVESKASSLLLWSGQPNEEDRRRWRSVHVDGDGIDNDSREIEGWPPIHSLRQELLHRRHGVAVRNSIYVKVKMAGVPIGRKVDLTRYDSYQALIATLVNMFAKYARNDSRNGDYTILYQDKEGDWLLAGDVPWETFVESVQRIGIHRNVN